MTNVYFISKEEIKRRRDIRQLKMQLQPLNEDLLQATSFAVKNGIDVDDSYQMKIWGTGAFDPATGQEDTSQDPSYALQNSYVTGIYFLCGM